MSVPFTDFGGKEKTGGRVVNSERDITFVENVGKTLGSVVQEGRGRMPNEETILMPTEGRTDGLVKGSLQEGQNQEGSFSGKSYIIFGVGNFLPSAGISKGLGKDDKRGRR